MLDTTQTMGEAFAQWARLTDAYAGQLGALSRREPGAAEELTRLGRLLGQCEHGIRDSSPVAHTTSPR